MFLDSPPTATPDSGDAELRRAMMATSRAILAKQLRAERELEAARESLRLQNEELTSTNALLTATLDATPLGVIAFSLQGRVGRINRRLDEMFKHESRIEAGLAPVLVHVDPMRMAQVFSNLINNAAKFTSPGGRIEINANVLGAEAVVSIADNGTGMTSD
jgi:signal transduction histidine kinase